MNNRHLFGWDLPPGVRVSDIPGNRPEDDAWESIYDEFWDKERLTTTHNGISISKDEYEAMDKIWKSNSKANKELTDLIDDYIMAAIEYGLEIGQKQAEATNQENRFYENRYITEALEKAGISQETIDKVEKILGENHETP